MLCEWQQRRDGLQGGSRATRRSVPACALSAEAIRARYGREVSHPAALLSPPLVFAIKGPFFALAARDQSTFISGVAGSCPVAERIPSASYPVSLRRAAEGPIPAFRQSPARLSALPSRFDLAPKGPSLTSPQATASLPPRCPPAATPVQHAHESPAILTLRRRWLRHRSRGRELALEAHRPVSPNVPTSQQPPAEGLTLFQA